MQETNSMKQSNDAGFTESLTRTSPDAQFGGARAMYNDTRAGVLLERQFLPFEE